MNLENMIVKLDEMFPDGWTLERRRSLYTIVLIDSKTQNIYAGDAQSSVAKAIDSALEKYNINENLFDTWKRQGIFG